MKNRIQIWLTRGLCLLLFMNLPVVGWDGAEWFRLTDEVSARWQIQTNENDTDRVRLSAKTPAEGQQYRVMVLFPKKSSAYDTAMAQILSVFEEKKLATEFTLIHFSGEDAAGDAAIEWAQRERQDLIFAMGSRSSAFILKWRDQLSIPVVTVCAKDPVLLGQVPDYQSGSGTNIAFTSLDVPIETQLAYLKQLKPNLSQLAVLYAVQNRSAVTTQVEPLVAAAERQGINIWRVAVQDQGNARAELESLVAETRTGMLAADEGGAHSVFWITGSTSVFREIETINRHSGKVPVLSVVPNVVKAGGDSAVLSIGVSFENNAQIAAIYGFRILTGQAKAKELPVGVISPPDIAVNFKKAIEIDLKIPFSFFESAGFVYDQNGELVRAKGQNLAPRP